MGIERIVSSAASLGVMVSALLFLPSANSQEAAGAGRFQLGTHYQRLPTAQGTSSNPDLIEVAEIFWYGCPTCYAFEPYLEDWREDVPKDVAFVRIPAVWNPLLELHARAFYTAEALGKGEEMHAPIFREIHVNGNPLNSEEALQVFFEGFDVSEDAFADAFNSFAVHTKMQRADELNRRYRVSGVPTLVVNGKYTTGVGMMRSYEELIEIIDELVEKELALN